MTYTATKPAAPTRPMKIGEFAAVLGTDPPTVRYYEAEGVLPEPARTEGGYRIYTDADVDRLRFIKQARALGLSLAEIREIATAREAGEPPCSYVRRLLARQISDTVQQIDQLTSLLVELEALEALAKVLPEQPSPSEACICHAIECSVLDESPGLTREKGDS